MMTMMTMMEMFSCPKRNITTTDFLCSWRWWWFFCCWSISVRKMANNHRKQRHRWSTSTAIPSLAFFPFFSVSSWTPSIFRPTMFFYQIILLSLTIPTTMAITIRTSRQSSQGTNSDHHSSNKNLTFGQPFASALRQSNFNEWYDPQFALTRPLPNTTNEEEIVLPRPENLQAILTNWYPPEVRIHWDYDRRSIRNCRLQSFQIIYQPTKSRYRIIQEVPPYYSNLTLDRLQPGIEYSVRINAVSEMGHINQSQVILFVSPDNESRRSHRKFLNRAIHTSPDERKDGMNVREDEVVIVVLVIAAWIGCILVFFNKWGKIRMLEPYQPQYKESFPNSIHSIHPKTSRMNTCTSVPPNMISLESRGSLIADRDILCHHNRLMESGQLYQCASGTTYHHPAYRPRLNSVFVGDPYHRNSLFPEPNMPRKVKSAEDLKSLVVQVCSTSHAHVPSTSTSVL